MKTRLLLLIGLFSSAFVQADQATLEYLYEPTLDTRQELLLDRVLTHARNAEFAYALTLSQDLLEDAGSMRESKPTTFGQLLVNHGIIQSASGDYSPGLSVMERGLGFMELNTNPFSKTLISGVMAMGLTELALDMNVKAEDTFRRAQHILHRQNGVYARDQMPIIDYLTKTSLKQGNLAAADREQRFNLRVAEQVYGPDSVELLPLLARLGGYFATRGSTIPPLVHTELRLQRDLLFRTSVNMYQRAVAIIEQNFGENDLRLVQPLRGMAQARLLQITNRKYAEAALERSLAIVQSNPDSDTTDRAQALVDLGDLYIITSDGKASQTYLEAWDLLQETEETKLLADAFFGAPTRLFPRENPVFFLERRPDAAGENDSLFVDLEFSVNQSGKVSSMKVIEKNVPNEQVRQLRYRIRNARYRPRIADGEILTTDGLLFHQPFAVLKSSPTTTASAETANSDVTPDEEQTPAPEEMRQDPDTEDNPTKEEQTTETTDTAV